MSSEQYRIGRKVKVTGKDIQGVIAFYGTTQFAPETWIGVKLDEPKGKNNGSVQGVEYFKCEDKHGLFVKPSQVVLLDDQGKPEDSIRMRRQSGIGMKPKPTSVRRKSPTKKPTSLSTSSSRMSLASSRQSLADSRQSLSGSRQSLSGSRQSLIGSRSQLASPVIEKNDNEQPSQIPKRASFVETGFVETLKPQFTPGQVITTTPTPITSIDEKINIIQLQQEIDNRNQQIKDLSEKLETLKIKRQEDKEKLKDFDKLKIQHEQLIEFRSKIMEAQASLQRELQRAKQEARDAIEAKETHEEEVADLAEAVEMATLDREMAEEKAETLQLELEVCKEKLEEVTLDLEILKTEMQEKGGAPLQGEQVSAYEIKQLQQQNARLRETLVRLRDLSAHDKHEYQKLLKDIEQKKSEIVELGKTKEKLSNRVEEMEQQISDLQEQVDAALGAEEMVVILAEQKLTLEEKLVQLKEEVEELEALQDMNDQLVESNAELEADLREELDLAKAATRQVMRDRDAALETIADRETTINKFRELVQKLQEQCLDLQHRLEKETSKPISALPEIIDFKKMFTETKAHTKAIDLELRRIDNQQLQNHIKYLTSYMPDSFMNRGSDHDAVLLLLLIPRLIQKSDILLLQIRDKFVNVDKVDRASLLKEHKIEQFSFRCRVSFYLYALQTILNQYYYALNTCKTETLLKVGASYIEMASQERVIDGFVELLKRDQLDENLPTEPLEKCVSYFNTLFPVLFGSDNHLNHTQLLSDNVKSLSSAFDGICNDAMVIRSLIEGANIGDIGLLAQHIITITEQIQQQLKLIKRRLPPEIYLPNLGLNKEHFENIYQCYQHSGKIIKTLMDIIKNSMQTLISNGEPEKGLQPNKIKDISINASDKIYEQDDLGPIQSIKNSLTFILTQITQIAQFLQDNEYEINSINKDEINLSPIEIRAQAVKKDLEQTKTLTSKLENKESDIKELRKALKEKQEQLSEMTIRKELAEKKLGNVNKDYELTIEKLQRKLEEAHNTYRKKEKEFEETLDHLQTDIDSLENEKGEMKEKLKLLSKKAQMEAALSKSTSGSQLSSLQSSTGPSLPAVVRDSPLLLQEIDNLRKLFHNERNERIKLQNQKMHDILDSLKPLPTFREKPDEILDNLMKEGAALRQEILMKLATPKFPPVYKAKCGNGQDMWKRHFAEENDKILNLRQRTLDFQNKVAKEVIKRKHGGRIETDLTVFPTTEMAKALNENEAVNVGFIKIPKTYLDKNEQTGIVDLELDFANLQKILQSLIH